MLRLPVCPHCSAVYEYREVRDMKKGSHICYHCKKKFRAEKRRGRIWFLLIVCALLILINLFIFHSSGDLKESELAVTVCFDAAVITAAVFMLPLTVRFIPEKITRSEKRILKEQHNGNNRTKVRSNKN